MARTGLAGGGSALVPISGFPFPVLVSATLEERAMPVARRCAGAYGHLSDVLAANPNVTLEVLAPIDWRASLPYGMPHFVARTLVVAGEEGEFWRAFVPLVEEAAAWARAAAVEVYGPDLRLAPFFDMLAVHELGHAFRDSSRSPRRWLDETFANLCLHSYVVAVEPGSLPALRTLPAVVTSVAPETFEYRSLTDFERLYSDLSRRRPLNYGWYQCHFHRMAERVYDAGGVQALQRLRSLESEPGVSDGELADDLRRHLGAEVAGILLDWPGD